MDNYAIALRNLDREMAKRLKSVFTLAEKNIAIVITKYKLRYPKIYSQGSFYMLNRRLQKEIDNILDNLKIQLGKTINYGTEKAWGFANLQNDAMIRDYIKGFTIISNVRSSFFQVNIEALKSFMDRSVSGFTLSDRIWKISKLKKYSLEQYLASGIATGKSAAGISLDIRRFEQNPDLLFRRVRDPEGILRLSKPALAYSPGRGVYRSSYKNAMRLSRTENMIAFHTSDFNRIQQLPFVKGIKIHLSASHPRQDICDEMTGFYPKGFLFTGWHPQCICYSETILSSKKDFETYLRTGEMNMDNYVTTIPKRAMNYLQKNASLIRKMKTKPYFLTNNFTNALKLKSKVA